MQEYVFAGTYTQTKSRGIYGFLQKNGRITQPQLLAERVSPTYLAVNKAATRLYAVDEPAEGKGTLGSYIIEKDDTGSVTGLTLQRDVEAPSLGLCHVVLSPDEKFLLCVSYMDATVQVYALEEDGSIGPMTDCFSREGQGPNTIRQESAHAHSITFVPNGSFFYLCDLGTDQLAAYKLQADGKLKYLPFNTVKVPGGYGPRHMTFSANGRWMYVAGEIVDHLLVYSYQMGSPIQVQDLLATERPNPAYTSAAVRATKDGKYVYLSNRGEDTITVFEVQRTGELLEVQRVPSGGITPREFTLSLDEKFAYAGNQDSDTLVVFRRDADTGFLTCIGITDEIGQPVCAVPIPIA